MVTEAQSSSPGYRLDAAPGKGVGLFATRRISIGELVIAEAPLFTASDMSGVLCSVERLDPAGQAAFFALTDVYKPGGDPTPLTIFKTNALPLGSGSMRGGLFPIISRINHSCAPNVHHSWCEPLGVENIYAARDIEAGEEILSSYMQFWLSRSDRQKRIRQKFQFECRCIACSGPLDRASDIRRAKIDHLDSIIPRYALSDPIATYRMAKERLRLLEEEGISYPIESARTLYDAYQACVAVSDFVAAKRYVGLAYAYALLAEGPWSQATTERYRTLYNDPSAHAAAGMLRRRIVPMVCDACGSDCQADKQVDHRKRDNGRSDDKRDPRTKGKAQQTTKSSMAELPFCKGCECAIYCSAQCEASHLKWHKPVCQVLSTAYGRAGTGLILL